MTKQTFEGLREYSVTIPSGEYEGKMWKANRGGIWYLYWYDHDDNPSMIKIERREILLLNKIIWEIECKKPKKKA